ncbi:uncharacterized protein VTP21DRAFT_4607 [Calcarisporiella thermophila]|uniref:uncharacterized protein n=1 Tax=Calcarisporiella thermophila TaxID=911321 RepID=UPI0037431DB1
MRSKSPVDLFQIRVNKPEILLRGSPMEAAGSLLHGSLVLTLNRPMKVRAVRLNFLGTMNILWKEKGATKLYKDKSTLINHKWIFATKTQLEAGKYTWNFKITLPGSTPETISIDGASISYNLEATIDRVYFSAPIRTILPIRITRVPSPTSLELLQTVVFENVWENKMAYELSMPSKVVEEEGTISANIKLEMLARGFNVETIACTLVELRTLRTENRTSTTDHIVQHVERNVRWQIPEEMPSNILETEMRIPLPKSTQLVHFDADVKTICVRHKLIFTLLLTNAHRRYFQLCVGMPVVIAARQIDRDLNELPSYEESFYTLPIEFPKYEALIISSNEDLYKGDDQSCVETSEPSLTNNISESSPEISSSPLNKPTHLPAPIRLPSYHTAISETSILSPVVAA